MFYILDVYSHHEHKVHDFVVHRTYPNPCKYLPDHKYQINLGEHENPLTALYSAKKMYPSRKIVFCIHCYGTMNKLSPREQAQLAKFLN